MVTPTAQQSPCASCDWWSDSASGGIKATVPNLVFFIVWQFARSSSRLLWPALFQPHGKVRARPGPSGEALCMAAPCKRHGVNDATRSLRV